MQAATLYRLEQLQRTLGPETPSGQLGEHDQSPAEELEVSRQAGGEEDGRRAEWDLVPDSSHPSSSIRNMGGVAAATGGGDGTGKAAPSHGALRALTV